MEQQESWYLSETETVLEVIFLSLLTATMSIGLQVCSRCVTSGGALHSGGALSLP
jgi:hypothetical protein